MMQPGSSLSLPTEHAAPSKRRHHKIPRVAPIWINKLRVWFRPALKKLQGIFLSNTLMGQRKRRRYYKEEKMQDSTVRSIKFIIDKWPIPSDLSCHQGVTLRSRAHPVTYVGLTVGFEPWSVRTPIRPRTTQWAKFAGKWLQTKRDR